MKHITIDKLKIIMDLDLDGNLMNLTNSENGMLFSLNNEDVLINACLDKKPSNMSIKEFVNNEIKTLKQMNFENSKINFLKEKLNSFKDVKVGKLKEVELMFYDTDILLLEKDNTKQLQFYVQISNYVLIIGLIFLNESKLTEQNFMTYPAVKKIIKCIKSIRAIK